MIVQCPQCAKQYEFNNPHASLKKLVKCRACGTEFILQDHILQPEEQFNPLEEVLAASSDPVPPAAPQHVEESTEPSAVGSALSDRTCDIASAGVLVASALFVVGCVVYCPSLWFPVLILIAIAVGIYAVYQYVITSDIPAAIYPAIYMPAIVIGMLMLFGISVSGQLAGNDRNPQHPIAKIAICALICVGIVILAYVVHSFVNRHATESKKNLLYSIVMAALLAASGVQWVKHGFEKSELDNWTALADKLERDYRTQPIDDYRSRKLAREQQIAEAARLAEARRKAEEAAAAAAAALARQQQAKVAPPPVIRPAPVQPAPKEVKLIPPDEWIKYAADTSLPKEVQRDYAQALAQARRTPLPGLEEARRDLRVAIDRSNKAAAAERDAALREMSRQKTLRDTAKRPTPLGGAVTGHSNYHNANALAAQQRAGAARAQEDQYRSTAGAQLKGLDTMEDLHAAAMEIPVHLQYGQLKKAVVVYNRARRDADKASAGVGLQHTQSALGSCGGQIEKEIQKIAATRPE